DNIAIIGLRSVDAAERAALQETTIQRVDMREIDETGIATPLNT
ncbi:MAG TPA: arginase, partial [Sulfitobacter pontiacus]|nr:arginase [Sulfitobacter pontiacus]